MRMKYIMTIAAAIVLGTLAAEARKGNGGGDRKRARDGSCIEAYQKGSCTGDRQKDQDRDRTRARDGSCQDA